MPTKERPPTKDLRLNADMGESFGPWTMGCDADLMPYVDLANVACGFHASDPDTMRHTVRLAREYGVVVGAHPAYPDLVGFGRRAMACTPTEIENMVLYQVGALEALCRAEGMSLGYVKPHGALYNAMSHDDAILAAVMRALSRHGAALPLVVMATRDTSGVRSLAREYGVAVWLEAFADRGYDGNGRLLPRRWANAVYHDAATILDQALRIARNEPLTASDGSELVLDADTLCVHGDNPESIAAIRDIRHQLFPREAS